MTNMKRNTVSFPDELADRIFALRADERFRRCSYSELVRILVENGLETIAGVPGVRKARCKDEK